MEEGIERKERDERSEREGIKGGHVVRVSKNSLTSILVKSNYIYSLDISYLKN